MPYIHRHVVCVCVGVSQSKRENHAVPQEGGWKIEWPYNGVCVCVCVHVYGKRETILFHRWGAGSPSCLALENHKTAGGISCSTGGGGGEYTMTSITY